MKLTQILLFFCIMLLCAIYDGSTIINITLICTVVPFTITLIEDAVKQEKLYQKKDKLGEIGGEE